MTLLNQSVQNYGQLSKLFETLRQGQAPDKFNREFLKDIGFKSSNHHAFIPLLKGLGFLTSDGTPTQRYKEFLDSTKWKKVIAEAVREAYGDIFVIKSTPGKGDIKLISGKYKSTYNISEISAERAARTFIALLDISDKDVLYGKEKLASFHEKTAAPLAETEVKSTEEQLTMLPIGASAPPVGAAVAEVAPSAQSVVGLHYNIQIHLPATKDVEVYNAIFKSLREHLLD